MIYKPQCAYTYMQKYYLYCIAYFYHWNYALKLYCQRVYGRTIINVPRSLAYTYVG